MNPDGIICKMINDIGVVMTTAVSDKWQRQNAALQLYLFDLFIFVCGVLEHAGAIVADSRWGD